MSMNALVGGADCGPVNPVARMVKHADVDRSLQKDRVGSRSDGFQLHHLTSSSSPTLNSSDAALARTFFDDRASPALPPQLISPFTPSRVASSQRFAHPHASTQKPVGSVTPFGTEIERSWAQDEAGPSYLNRAWDAANVGPQEAGTLPKSNQMGLGTRAGPFAPSMMGALHRPMVPINSARMIPTAQQVSDWDRGFSQAESDDSRSKGKAKMGLDVVDLEKTFQQLATEEKDETRSTNPDYMSDFQKVWEQVGQNVGQSPADLAEWEAQYHQLLQSHREEVDGLGQLPEDFDYDNDIMTAWQREHGRGLTSDMNERPAQSPYDAQGLPKMEPYAFDAQNPNLALPGGNLLAQAKEFIENNGSLSEACLLIEAAIQKGELGEGGYEAWIMLGETRSMDEQEELGLRALRNGVDIAKSAGHIGPGMMSLAVSYTNEGHEQAAYFTLAEWLKSLHPDTSVAPLKPPNTLVDSRFGELSGSLEDWTQMPQDAYSYSPWHVRDVVKDGFLRAAQALHAQGNTDPDIQAGLGILYYSESEYDKAKDCFEAALWSRPSDYLLWNRLGSCLSNGSKPEQALEVYREALRLRPTYTRAIFNVGVACMNIGAFKEAAEHFLSALVSQKTASGRIPLPESSDHGNEQLWRTLKRTFVLMDRPDLADFTSQGDVEVFRAQGFEF